MVLGPNDYLSNKLRKVLIKGVSVILDKSNGRSCINVFHWFSYLMNLKVKS